MRKLIKADNYIEQEDSNYAGTMRTIRLTFEKIMEDLETIASGASTSKQAEDAFYAVTDTLESGFKASNTKISRILR